MSEIRKELVFEENTFRKIGVGRGGIWKKYQERCRENPPSHEDFTAELKGREGLSGT